MRLKEAGAALAFDDFGAGFSSLSNLHKFSFDYLKVDKSFIKKLGDDADAAKIVGAVARLGADLGMTVIAEGVESTALAEAAHKNGCRLGQGFAFGDAERSASKTPASGDASSDAKTADTSKTNDAPADGAAAAPVAGRRQERRRKGRRERRNRSQAPPPLLERRSALTRRRRRLRT